MALRSLSDLPGFLRYVVKRWSEDRCPQIAASLTYTTLLALVPIFAIAVAVLSSAPFFESVMIQIKVFLLLNLVPEIAHTLITVYMEAFARNAAKLTAVGVAALFVTAIALLFSLDRSLNAIWRVSRARPYWVSIVGYALLLVLAPLLIGLSMSLTTYLVTLSMRYASVPPEAESWLVRAIPASISATAFFLLYRIVPHRPVAWRHALAGAIVAAILFEVAKELFALYIRHAAGYSMVYGTFALLPIFMIWVYLSWLVVLFGAELTAALELWGGARWRRATTVDVRFREAVAVTRRLVEAQGEAVTLERLRLDTAISGRELHETLARLQREGIVAHEGSRYRLARPAADVSFGALYGAVSDVKL
ncbi:MAG: YihY family inner membrane protein [Bacillota bacterium]